MALEDMLTEMAKRPITSEERDAIKKDFSLTTDVVVPVGNAGVEQTPNKSMAEKPSAIEKMPAKEPSKIEKMPFNIPSLGTPYVKEVQTEQLTPKTSLENILAAKQGASKLTRPSSFTDYLPLLAPIAVEALFGGGKTSGFSLGMSGKAILDKEAEAQKNVKSLEDKLMEMQSLKSTVKYGTGEMDKEAAKQARFEAAQKQKKEQKEQDIEIAAGARFQQKLEQDQVFKDYKNQMVQGQRALEFLAQGRGVSDAGLRTVFAKGIFGDVGNIAVQEAAAISGSPMLFQKYETLKDMWFKGTRFGDQDRADLIEIAALVRDKAPAVLQKYAQQKAQAEQQISGVDVSQVASALSRDSVTNEVMVKVLYNGRIKSIPIRQFPEAVRKYKATLYTGK